MLSARMKLVADVGKAAGFMLVMSEEDVMDVQQILVGTQEALTARRVFGEPVNVNGTTIIPAAVVRGGGGGGGKKEEAGGAGFKINARPAGVYVVRDGAVAWRPAVDVNKIILGGQIVGIVALLVLKPLIARWFSPRT